MYGEVSEGPWIRSPMIPRDASLSGQLQFWSLLILQQRYLLEQPIKNRRQEQRRKIKGNLQRIYYAFERVFQNDLLPRRSQTWFNSSIEYLESDSLWIQSDIWLFFSLKIIWHRTFFPESNTYIYIYFFKSEGNFFSRKYIAYKKKLNSEGI